MKTSMLPAVRVEPQLRKQLEFVLHEGETLSAFVEASVRDAVRRRAVDTEFVARGLASLEAAKAANDFVEADDVLARLQQRVDRARGKSKRRASR